MLSLLTRRPPFFCVYICCLRCSTIPSVVRAMGSSFMGAVNSINTRVAPMQQHCSVSTILVMYGLPRLLLGSIVAHELMHAYLRMRHVTGLPLQVKGGGQLWPLRQWKMKCFLCLCMHIGGGCVAEVHQHHGH